MEEQIKPVHLVIVLLSYYLDYSVSYHRYNLLFYSLASISGIYATASKEHL